MSRCIYLMGSLIALAIVSRVFASGPTTYRSPDDKSSEQAIAYLKTHQDSDRYLIYRDTPSFISKYVSGTKTLDYGAGTGASTQFLLTQNLDVIGVDISPEMISQAMIHCSKTPFFLIQKGHVPVVSHTFDLVFSSFVLFELGSEEEILTYLNEAKRVLKNEGIFIAITGSEEMYTKDWFMFNSDYPENKHLKSGDVARVYLRDADIEFFDYYWTEADYRHFFHQAGFELLEVHYPLGKEGEMYPWKDEKTHSPYVIFVAKKAIPLNPE